jgi:hypothetical protein
MNHGLIPGRGKRYFPPSQLLDCPWTYPSSYQIDRNGDFFLEVKVVGA